MTRFCATTTLAVAIVFCGIGPAGAQAIYKSVDADGNVTFSSTPPEGAVEVTTVKVYKGPSEEEIAAAQERLQRSGGNSDGGEGDEPTGLAAEIATARQVLREAQTALVSAQTERDGDSYIDDEGRKQVTQAYVDRVDLHSEAVKVARQRVDRLENGPRKVATGDPTAHAQAQAEGSDETDE